jgi:hypothetical protein
MKQIICFTTALIFLFSCGNKADKKSETGISIADTLLNKIETIPQFAAITDSSKLMVIKRDGKSVTYPAYKKTFVDDASTMQPIFKWEDIDGDGNNEIIISSYTGGAHCCDVNTILNRSGETEMQEVLDFTGGTWISKDTVSLSFFEALGYFHTCYACAIEYPKQVDPTAYLSFKKGKFSFVPASKKMNDDIEMNLKAITAKPIPDKDAADESGFDDGTRKAIAFNIAAYYFNNGRDIKAAQNLFDKYYTHKDKSTIWKDLDRILRAFDEDIRKAVALQ